MKAAAAELRFEEAALLRDELTQLRSGVVEVEAEALATGVPSG